MQSGFIVLVLSAVAVIQPATAASQCEIPKAFVEKCLRTPGYAGDTKFVSCSADGRPLCCYLHRDGTQTCSIDPEMKISGPQYPGPHAPLPPRPKPAPK